MSRRKSPPPPAPLENLGLFSESELFSEKPAEKPEEEQEAAPPGTKEKLAMRASKDDGRPAQRRLASLRSRNHFRVEEQGGEGAPLAVSIRDMETRTFWRRAGPATEKNPLYALERAVPEAPALGEQWLDATSEIQER